MIERRKYPRWKQDPEFLPPSRKSVLLPLIVIPMMVYLYAAPQENPPVIHTLAPLIDGEVRIPAVAAPVQGVTGDGRAFVCPPSRWPVLEFCWFLTEERR